MSSPQPGLSTVRCAFVPALSRFTVQAFATGLLSAFGHSPKISIRKFRGAVQFTPGTYQNAFVQMQVDLASLDILDPMKSSDREKMQHEMFDVVLNLPRFPTAIFESHQIDVPSVTVQPLLVHVHGDLTFRGVTHPHTFSARVSIQDSSVRVSGDFSLSQSEYGIKPVSLAGGVLRLKDELKFKFDLFADPDASSPQSTSL